MEQLNSSWSLRWYYQRRRDAAEETAVLWHYYFIEIITVNLYIITVF